MTNQIIQGLWIGGDLSIMEQLSISSFLKHRHEYHLYTYEEVKNIPPGTIIKDGNEILPKDKIFVYQQGWGNGSFAGFADLFRYHLLAKKGGWWADTDIICLKPFDFSSDYIIASSYEGKWGEPANNCVLKMPSNSELALYLVEKCNQMNFETVKFGETGPHLVQKAVRELRLNNYVVSHNIFCPITWRAVDKIVYQPQKLTLKKIIKEAKDIVRPIIRPYTKIGKINNQSYAVHLWNEIWRQNKLNKNNNYAKSCLYEKLKSQYL
jgi:mannosyltransferase OCH1-like enzyme